MILTSALFRSPRQLFTRNNLCTSSQRWFAQRVWYTILDIRGTPIHKHFPDFMRVPENTSVEKFRHNVRNDNLFILTGVGVNQLRLFENRAAYESDAVLNDHATVQGNTEHDPVVVVKPELEAMTSEEFERIQTEEIAIHCQAYSALRELAESLHEKHAFKCRYGTPKFSDLARFRRTIGSQEFFKLYGCDFTEDEWDRLVTLNEASNRVMNNRRLPRTHSGAEFTIFHPLPEYPVEDQIRTMEKIIRRIETVPGAQVRVSWDEIKKIKK